MANNNSKKIKLEPILEVSQLDAAAVATKPSIHNMRRADLIKEVQDERNRNEFMAIRNEQLKSAFERDLDVVNKQNQELSTERDSLLQQLHEMSKNEVLSQQQLQQPEQLQQFVVKIQELPSQQQLQQHEQLQQFVVKIQELTSERDSLLHQLQEEMSKIEALRQQLLEHEQSRQCIVESVAEENTIRMQEMSQQIEELTNQRRVFDDEKRDLTEQLDQINEENTCSICLSPWEAQGDHRIVSLHCGHLFGKNCIWRQLTHNPECPICKQQVLSGDMRNIFVRRILPVRRRHVRRPVQPARPTQPAHVLHHAVQDAPLMPGVFVQQAPQLAPDYHD